MARVRGHVDPAYDASHRCQAENQSVVVRERSVRPASAGIVTGWRLPRTRRIGRAGSLVGRMRPGSAPVDQPGGVHDLQVRAGEPVELVEHVVVEAGVAHP